MFVKQIVTRTLITEHSIVNYRRYALQKDDQAVGMFNLLIHH